MDIRLLAAALLSIVWATTVRAQSVPTAAEKAAMERAQREADGPRRRILEAAKVKGTVRPDAPTPVAAPAAPAAVAVTPAAPATAAVRRDEPADRISVLVTLPAAVEPVQLPTSAVATMPAVSRVELAPAPAALAALPAVPVSALPPPRLLSKVDPALPSRLQRRGLRRMEVVVELTIAADGSVREVSLRDAADEELAASVREAVLQWRYEPQPVARPHLVQLVFGAG